jgi:hypothetical protein
LFGFVRRRQSSLRHIASRKITGGSRFSMNVGGGRLTRRVSATSIVAPSARG